jgi:SAM-dependent methyltransferase
MRSAGPRERSGPIGITSGDFSTPLVRKRTTTQPRGVPVVGGKAPVSLDEPVTADSVGAPDAFEDEVTPPPQTAETTDMGAVPARALDALPAAMPTRPPPPPVSGDESPFGGGPAGSVDNDAEAAALAAEAAAVRALDDGPQTPPPEVTSGAPEAAAAPEPQTPPPEVAPMTRTPPAEVAAAPTTPPPDVVQHTPPPEITVVRPAPPDVVAASRNPASGAVEATQTPSPESVTERTPPPEITAVRTPPAEIVEASRTPAPEMGAVGAPPSRVTQDYSSPIAAAAASAASDADQVTPPPQPKQPPENVGAAEADGGALPTLAMQANAGLANLPAVALSDAEGLTDGEVDGDEHVEVLDGPEGAPDDESVAATAKSLRNAAPPPIPGSHLRTPGPEMIAPRVEAITRAAASPDLPAIVPEALAQRPRRPRRSKPWFEEVFDEDYLRTLPFMRADQTLREVEFISDALRLGPAAEILDIACGYGRHAIELVQRGYNVTGLDLSLPLLIRAADEAQRRSLAVNFVHADMREMAFEKQFDGAYSMLTSFGYFDEDTNLRVAERIGRALKPGARFLLDVVNRDYVVSDLPVRVWWEGTGCVVLEEVDFNFHTSRIVTHRSIVFEDGRQLEQEISVRAYSLHEIGRLLRQAGFRVMDVSGGLNTRGQFFGNVSRSLLIVAEKRDADTAQPL